ncbi:MAG: c-type cytochrome [Coriobacteriia bacterium]|nr:c-type cytochrome [Coriobacteriia bacterium]
MKMTPRLIVIGGLAVVLSVVAVVVFLPNFVFKPADTLYARPYTALEQEGRDIYTSNGCMYCHSQFTRPEDIVPGKAAEAGAYNYDRPHQLGTLRTGPDLSNIGLKRGDQWEKAHLMDPRAFSPDTIMPSFKFLNERQLTALVAYLNRLGNQQTASTDLMIPDKYKDMKQPFKVTSENWDRGRDIYARNCLTCHGCAGKGDGPYAMINNARPADLRQPRFSLLPDSFFMWRVSEGVAGTIMPPWRQSLTEEEIWLVTLFEKRAFMDMVPHLTDEGDLPAAYDKPDPIKATTATLDAGKSMYVANCSFCHGYSGVGDGPDAAGLLPAPPDFRDREFYKTWKDGDWFWRVSESLPMRAMPKWKTWFDEEQRWLIATYVRDMLSLTTTREPDGSDTPANYEAVKAPETASVARGRAVYFKRCWMCHGDAGQGEGPSGDNLNPPPANFTDPDVKTMSDGRWFWRVSEGVGNSAMPIWRLLLSEQDRWDVIAYERAMFVEPKEPDAVSDEPPVEYQALDPAPLEDTPAARDRGKKTYERLCVVCHGAKAKGDGPFGAPLKPPPADLTGEPAVVSDAPWWYWRVSEGVAGVDPEQFTAMPPWKYILTEQERWEVVFYGRALAGAKDPVVKP